MDGVKQYGLLMDTVERLLGRPYERFHLWPGSLFGVPVGTLRVGDWPPGDVSGYVCYDTPTRRAWSVWWETDHWGTAPRPYSDLEPMTTTGHPDWPWTRGDLRHLADAPRVA